MEFLINFLASRISKRLTGASPRHVIGGAILLSAVFGLAWFAVMRRFGAAWMSPFTVAVGLIGLLCGVLVGARFRRVDDVDHAPLTNLRLYRLNETLGWLFIGVALIALFYLLTQLKDDPKNPMPTWQKAAIFASSALGGLSCLIYFWRQVLYIDIGERLYLTRLQGTIDITAVEDYRLIIAPEAAFKPNTIRVFVMKGPRAITSKDLSLTQADQVLQTISKYHHGHKVLFSEA